MKKKHATAFIGNELEIIDMVNPSTELLPFKLKTIDGAGGKSIECYEIPDNEKGKVLEKLYPFTDIPDLNACLYDLHQDALFTVKEFMVVRTDGKNYLVSPYYPQTGGTVLDWLDAKCKDEGDCFVKTFKTNALKPE